MTVDAEDLAESAGFWVSAIWLCPEYGLKRLIDLTEDERANRADHWDRLGRALRNDFRYVQHCTPR
jgi:hypothetical protein